MRMKKENLGTILAIMTAIVSGIAIPVNKIFVVDLDPMIFTALRALIIGIIFLSLQNRKISVISPRLVFITNTSAPILVVL